MQDILHRINLMILYQSGNLRVCEIEFEALIYEGFVIGLEILEN
jgi:hypothetical protein